MVFRPAVVLLAAVLAPGCIEPPPSTQRPNETGVDAPAADMSPASDTSKDPADATTATGDTAIADLGADAPGSTDVGPDLSGPAGWWKRFVIPANSVEANIPDFVVLVESKDEALGGLVSGARHLRFVSPDGTPYPSQIESFDATSGALRAWVRLPMVSLSDPTTFRLELLVDPPRDMTESVWTDWSGVWHLDEHRPGQTATDSSPTRNDGEILNTDANAEAAGKIGRAIRFDGVDDHIRVPDHETLRPTDGFTLSAWVYLERSYGSVLSRPETQITDYNNSYQLWLNEADEFVATLSVDADPDSSLVAGYTLDVWHHLVITWDGQNLNQYVDGSRQLSTPRSGTVDYDDHPLYIGIDKNLDPLEGTEFIHMPLQGVIDEARIRTTPVSDERIHAWWTNQDAPIDFLVESPVQPIE